MPLDCLSLDSLRLSARQLSIPLVMAFLLFNPLLLEDVVNNEEALKLSAGLDFVGTGGGALGLGVGDNLDAAGIRLLNFYGAPRQVLCLLRLCPKITTTGGSSASVQI